MDSSWKDNNSAFTSKLTSGQKSEYNTLLEKCKNHKVVPSFNNTQVSLEYNPSTGKYEKTITDTNGVLSQFTFKNTSTLTYTRSGNSLKIVSLQKIDTATKTASHAKSVPSAIQSLVVFWSDGKVGSSRAQACVGGAEGDPVSFSFSVKTTGGVGSLKVEKVVVGTDGGTAFPFKISPIPATLPSGVAADGTFTLKGGQSKTFTNLPLGTKYTVTE